jgi:transposase
MAIYHGNVAELTSLESFSLYRNRAEPDRSIHKERCVKKGQRRRVPDRAKKPKVDWKALEIMHPEAAGIDIGGSEHWVAINPERDPEPVRCFDCFTADVERMADWLMERGVRSVAMQSTGVYWIPVFEILQQRGLEVYLVNARHTKNLPGRKSDVLECQWLLKLHTFGLLNNSFQPSDETRVARTLWRHRGGLVAEASITIQRMQKVLTEMNIQLSNVLSDLSGVSGMRIVQAILDGERDPKKLAALADPGVKASKAVIAKSLRGNWRGELLFVLKQEVELYRIWQSKIADCDRQLQFHLKTVASKVDLAAQPLGLRPKRKKKSKNAPQFDLRSELYRISGVDWSQVDGIDVQTAQSVIAEVGVDLSAFATEKNFTSWLTLSPCNDSSGKKMLNRHTPKSANRAKVALRQSASTLERSQSYLGAQYRRLKTRLGAPKAITAMARKLACLFYRLLKYGQQYVDKGVEFYEERYKEQQIRYITRRAKQYGLQVLPAAAPAA